MALAQLFALFIVPVLLWPFIAAWLLTRPPRFRTPRQPPADWRLKVEPVTFPGRDGTRLEGWYLPSRNGAAVLLVHDHGSNRLGVAFHAGTLAAAGYGVLFFDLRAHGQSGGRRFDPGSHAIDDVLAGVTWLSRRHDVLGRIGVMGVSLGGTLAIQAAARNAFIRAVAADGPVPAATDDMPPPQGWFDRLWRTPRARAYLAAVARLSGNSRPPSLVSLLPRISQRPILFISTRQPADRRFTQHLYALAKEPKRLWAARPNGHLAGWTTEPDAYAREMLDFFHDALLSDEDVLWNDAEPMSDEASPHDQGARAAEQPPHPPAASGLQPIGERTVSLPTAMMIAFAVLPVAMMGLFIPFQLRWGLRPPSLPSGWLGSVLLAGAALLVLGLAAREAVLWAAYRWIGGAPRGAVRFTAGHAAFGPRARSESPVSARAYRVIILLPMLLLGVLPGIAGVLSGSWPLVLWALWMIAASSGEVAAFWALRGLPAATPVRRHPVLPGCEILPSENNVQNIDNF